MATLRMESGDPQTLVSHLALYGLVSILEARAPGGAVRAHWSGGMAPRAVVDHEGPEEAVGDLVRAHAVEHALSSSWPAAPAPHGDAALFSPRMTAPTDAQAWTDLLQARRAVIDGLTSGRAVLDLRMIGGLGELSHWHRDQQGKPRVDSAASRYDMQARNAGNDLVRIKIAKLAKTVAARTSAEVAGGLAGRTLTDELAKDKPAGRSATGFAPLGFVDNAIAWCAFWGLSALPVAPGAARPSRTSTILSRSTHRPESAVLPLWTRSMRTARMRAMLADQRLIHAGDYGDESDTQAAEGAFPATDRSLRWLSGLGVAALIKFEVEKHGTDKAPERRAARGELIRVNGAHH